jgi:unsaturated rhamnogalacturonyl hydrolase
VGQGRGLVFAALADVLELMPPSHPDYPEILRIFNEVADGLAARQDEKTGVWTQLLQYPAGTVFYAKNYAYRDKGDTKFEATDTRENYFESSASSMFAYGFLKGVRLGKLDRAVYEPVAKKAYQGVIDTFISGQETGVISINQICLSAGLGPASKPARDGSAEYYLFYDKGREAGDIVSNEGKAIGPFIMASLEYEQLYDINVKI